MTLPACGLYRTGVGLVGREAAVGAGQLVYFHNHSKQGPPLVLPTTENVNNRWRFAERGYLVQGEGAEGFLGALTRLPAQGFYAVTGPIRVSDDRVLPPRTLVQVGYNRVGEAILFVAEAQGNGFWFSTRGFRFTGLEVFERLREAGFDPPAGGGIEVDEQLLH